jgi:hypothetical protein
MPREIVTTDPEANAPSFDALTVRRARRNCKNVGPENSLVCKNCSRFVHRSPWSRCPTTKSARHCVVTSVVNRYYDPATDQFLSIDPDVDETDQPYSFVGDNPLNGGRCVRYGGDLCGVRREPGRFGGVRSSRFSHRNRSWTRCFEGTRQEKMRVDVPIATGLGILTIASVVTAVQIWRFGYRRYTDEEIQSGRDITVRLKVINGRTLSVLPLAPFSILMIYLSAEVKGQVHGSDSRTLLTIVGTISFCILILTCALIFTLRSRAWPRRLIPPRFRTEWVSIDSIR